MFILCGESATFQTPTLLDKFVNENQLCIMTDSKVQSAYESKQLSP